MAMGRLNGIRKSRNDLAVDVDAAKEDILIEELIVVMKEDRGMVHGREAKGRVPQISNESTVVTTKQGEDA